MGHAKIKIVKFLVNRTTVGVLHPSISSHCSPEHLSLRSLYKEVFLACFLIALCAL